MNAYWKEDMWGWLAGLLAFEVSAEILLHKWATSQRLPYLVIGVIMYVLLALVFAHAMRHGELTTINAGWQCGNIVLVSAYGVLVLRDKLTLRQKVGVGAATLAVFLMQ